MKIPDKATEEYRESVIGPLREVMPEDVSKIFKPRLLTG